MDRRKKTVLQQSSQVQSLWNDVSAEMMTEEDTGSDDNFIRHRQSWRSEKFNNFIEELDSAKNAKTLAKKREIGSGIERDVPQVAKTWLIAAESDCHLEQ